MKNNIPASGELTNMIRNFFGKKYNELLWAKNNPPVNSFDKVKVDKLVFNKLALGIVIAIFN